MVQAEKVGREEIGKAIETNLNRFSQDSSAVRRWLETGQLDQAVGFCVCRFTRQHGELHACRQVAQFKHVTVVNRNARIVRRDEYRSLERLQSDLTFGGVVPGGDEDGGVGDAHDQGVVEAKAPQQFLDDARQPVHREGTGLKGPCPRRLAACPVAPVYFSVGREAGLQDVSRHRGLRSECRR